MRAGRNIHLLGAALLLHLATAFEVQAESPTAAFPGESRPTASRLVDARKLLDEKKWSEAVDELQSILDTAGSDLVPVTPRYSVPARKQCHLLIAGLPAEAMQAYRARMEPQARKWLEAGRANRDVHLLRKVVDEAFCTRAGEIAIDTLGDLAFERGRFEEAEAWWRRLAPLPIDGAALDSSNDLVYPDPQAAPAKVCAKQVVARVFRNPLHDWRTLLKEYRDKYGDAKGTLAGRSGKYADLLEQIAREARVDPPPEITWSTYGGSPMRGLVLPAAPRFFDDLERLCRRGPTFTFDLQERKEKAEGESTPLPAATPTAVSRSLAFHPLIVGNYAVVSDAMAITAYDLTTGKSSVWFDLKESSPLSLPELKLPLPESLLDLRYTMTLADGCLYARLGLQHISQPEDEKNRDRSTASALVCLNVDPPASGKRLRWLAQPMVLPGQKAGEQKGAIFEGAPVVWEGRLYVAATYFEGDRTITAVICYPTGTEETPAPRWSQAVCATQELRGREKRTRHHLLTAAGPNIVYCSHSGAIVALDALSGKPAWAVRYPGQESRENSTHPVVRDLSPPVYADGQIFVAPADYDHLLCLDAMTGQIIWDREHVEPTHLLGVGQDRLIFTTIHGLRAVRAADGSDLGRLRILEGQGAQQPADADVNGWRLPDGGGERAPAGRGMLIGDKVLWPTANGIVVCDQADGALDYRPTLGSRVPAGNMVFANGCLAVADRTTLSVFVPDRLVLDKRVDQTRLQPENAKAWIDRARAEADIGAFDKALTGADKAVELIGSKVSRDLRRMMQELWLSLARAAAGRREWRHAEIAAKNAIVPEQPAVERLESLIQVAQMWEDQGQPARAVEHLQIILAAHELRQLPAFAFSRRQLTAGRYAADRIDRLIKKHGPEVYAKSEADARLAFQSASEDPQGVGALERLITNYPNAHTTGPALRELLKCYQKAGRHGAATTVCRRLLANAGDPDADLLISLARAYEQEKCPDAARAAWQRLAICHGEAIVPELDAKASVRAVVADRLAKLPGTSNSGDAFDLPLPLSRKWQIDLMRDEEVLPGAGCSDVLITARPGSLSLRELDSGSPRWQRRLPFTAQWAARSLDTVIAAGAAGVACLRQDDGDIIWEIAAPTLFAGRRPAALASFQLANGRCFFVAEGKWLFALDAESGNLLWHQPAPGAGLDDLPSKSGVFSPGFLAHGDAVLVQPAEGRSLLLDASTGKVLRSKSVNAGLWWPRPWLRDNDALCFTPNARTIAMMNPKSGRSQWELSLTDAAGLSGEPPLLIGSKDALLVMIPTNLGDSLQRLDPATGQQLWKQAELLPGKARPVEPAGWALDDKATYFEQDGHLVSRDLGDGRALWDRPLFGPRAPYYTHRLHDYLLTYPAITGTQRFQFRFLWGSVQWERAVDREDGRGPGLPVTCTDPKTGQVIQRLNFTPPSRLNIRAGLSQRFTIQPCLDVGSAERRPLVQVTPNGLVVAANSRVWRLVPAGN